MVVQKTPSTIHSLPVGPNDLVFNPESIYSKLTNNDIFKYPPDAITVNFYIFIALSKIFIRQDTVTIFYILKNSSSGCIDEIQENIIKIASKFKRELFFTQVIDPD